MRLISLRLSRSEADAVNQSTTFARSLSTFLESEVRAPFTYQKVSATAFALKGTCPPEQLDDYVETLQKQIMEFLFGTQRDADGDVLFYSGEDVEVARFLTESEAQARARSQKYLKKIKERRLAEAQPNAPAFEALPGKRDLLYRGILLCRHKVLLSYAITPAANHRDGINPALRQDINIGHYLELRGDQAIDYSNRIFDKASYLLQTGSKQNRSMILVVPLSYSSLLSSKDREKFLALVRTHPDWVRQSMILSVFGCPGKPGSSVVQRFFGEFSHWFRLIDWQVSDPDFDLSVFQGCGLHGITLDTYAIRSNQRSKAVERFLRRLPEMKSAGLRGSISGISTVEELRHCMGAGLVYASGDAVTAPLSVCAPAQQVELRDLPILEPTIHNAESAA
ncbi:MAG: hypothetical protein CMK06_00840 [Ponticaulis sp.]|nr:hypothetical protein [Ponticaulis sp.]